MKLLIKAYGATGNECTLHGPGAGAEGVWMAADQVEGLFDAPVRQAWDATAHQIGGTMQGMWYDVRDLMLGVHI
jgi:hypothetical protein